MNSLIMKAFCRYWRGSAQYPPMYQGWMNAAPQRARLDQGLQMSQAARNAPWTLEMQRNLLEEQQGRVRLTLEEGEAAEQQDQEEHQPGDGVGHHEAAAHGPHQSEQSHAELHAHTHSRQSG